MTLQEIQYATNKLFYQLVEYSRDHKELPERVDTAIGHAAAQLIKLRTIISTYNGHNGREGGPARPTPRVLN